MLEVINIDENEKWDSIVKSFEKHDVYYLSGYLKAFQIHGDGEPILFYYEDENMRAINAVMKRDVANIEYFKGKIKDNVIFDISTPYGYGGFLIEGTLVDDSIISLDEEYSKYCKENGIVSEFVRFHPVLNNSTRSSQLYDITDLGRTVTINLESKEEIWKNFSSQNRNKIRKAIKSGVEIFWGRNQELIDSFIPIYNGTMDKDDATDYYYFKNDFYESVLNDIKYNSLIFYAVYDKKIISMSMIIFINNQMHYHLSAMDKEYQKLASMNLLLYEAACWGSENGIRTFHLGGGLGSKEDSLFKFKKSFNRNPDTLFSIGKKVFDKEMYDELVALREGEIEFRNDSSFFPAYRL